ncbi:MAG: hypothetical protein HS117_24460 [Verrucomicrobiaceae bacterium]|nr:hypothetical protein [Verrucomicrobiaceae bacterium]
MSFEIDPPDPTAVFACAVSLRDACEEKAAVCGINLNDEFQGGDQFWREVMRIAELLETWACENVAFDALEDVWPYLLEEKFGCACLEHVHVDGLTTFALMDCPMVAMNMEVPLMYRDGRNLPPDGTVSTTAGSSQQALETCLHSQIRDGSAPIRARIGTIGAGMRATGQGMRATGQGMRAAGAEMRAAGQGMRMTGEGMRMTGEGTRAAGQGMRATGQGMRAAGQGMRATGVGMRAAGAGVRMTGEGMRATGAGMRAAGDAKMKGGDRTGLFHDFISLFAAE